MSGSLALPALPEQPGEYAALKEHLSRITGLREFSAREGEFRDRLHDRMRVAGCESYSRYLSLLLDDEQGQVELQGLLAALTNGETYFFRHPEVFAELRDRVIPELARAPGSARPIHVWSAGCSIGAEPYSIAMMLRTHFPTLVRTPGVTILATDLNCEYLEVARKGEFDPWALRSLSGEDRARLFSRQGERWAVREEDRRLVRFQCHNLVQEPLPRPVDGSAFDIVFFRNVSIYFSSEVTRDLLCRIEAAIRPGGWLIVGPSETCAAVSHGFDAVHGNGAVLFRKRIATGANEPSIRVAPCELSLTKPAGALDSIRRSLLRDRTRQLAPRDPGSGLQSGPVGAGSMGPSRSADEPCEDARNSEQDQLRSRFDPSLQLIHGRHCRQLGALSAAESSLRRALFLDRTMVMAQLDLAELLDSLDRRDEARRHFLGALAALRDMRDTCVVHHSQGATAHDLRVRARMGLGQRGAR